MLPYAKVQYLSLRQFTVHLCSVCATGLILLFIAISFKLYHLISLRYESFLTITSTWIIVQQLYNSRNALSRCSTYPQNKKYRNHHDSSLSLSMWQKQYVRTGCRKSNEL